MGPLDDLIAKFILAVFLYGVAACALLVGLVWGAIKLFS